MVNACIETLSEIVAKDKRIVVLGSDAMNIRERFSLENKKQYIEMGIAESNLIAAASGMSMCGIVPYVYAVSPFLVYRANEFIRDDVCLQKRNVKIIGYSAGMDYCTSGPTHHATEDIAMLRVLPNLTILSPGSVKEVKQLIENVAYIDGPIYIRLNRESNREIHLGEYQFRIGKAQLICDGNDLTIISTGSITYDVCQAAKQAQKRNISVRILHMDTIKPLDKGAVLKAAKETRKIITVEEHSIIGGLGSAVAEILAESDMNVKLVRMGLNDTFAIGYGNHDEIKKMNGLAAEDILKKIFE